MPERSLMTMVLVTSFLVAAGGMLLAADRVVAQELAGEAQPTPECGHSLDGSLRTGHMVEVPS